VRKILNIISLTLASGFYLSYLPARLRKGKRWTGAGALGSLWGLLTLPLVPREPILQGATLLGAIGLSIVVCGRAEAILGVKDDQRIILDEWAGYWVSIAFLPREWTTLVSGFILFRFFDMWKGPLGDKVSKFSGGWGVVLDDVLAGLAANLTLQAFRFFLSS
jgi:phosphatidylglycerophosphatase A